MRGGVVLAKHNDEESKTGSGSETSPEEVKLDFSKIMRSIKNFFSGKSPGDKKAKINAAVLTTILVLIPIILTIYIRLQPEYLSVTDSWAQNSVNNYFKNQIAQSVNSQYPNLPTQNKQALIDQQFADFSKSNQASLDQQIKATSQYFRAGFQYQENNHTYTFLGDLDSYFFLRYARNLLQKGTICDEVRNGTCWDNHMFAPLGNAIEVSLHPYGIFYLYKVLHAINPTINLMQASFLLPTVLAIIASIAIFFVGKRIMNETAGFFAAIFLAASPVVLSRTLGSDTDIWNVILPLIILWLFLEAFEAKSMIKKYGLMAVAGLFMGIFSFAWPEGWWYIFDFALVTIVAYIGFSLVRNFLKHKKLSKIFNAEVKSTLVILLVLVLASALFVSLFTSFNTFKVSVTDPVVRNARFKEATHADYWPNIQTTVAEMNEASINSIVSQTAFGKNIFFALALMGIVFCLISKKPVVREYLLVAVSALIFIFLTSTSGLALPVYTYLLILMIPVVVGIVMLLRREEREEGDIDIKPAILLIIWFVGMIFASTKGVRFIALLVPAFAVALGVAIGYVYQHLTAMIHKEFKISEKLVKATLFILLCLLLIMPVRVGVSTGQSFIPTMTRGWWDSLLKINNESAPNAIINSWWDFGHWFKYVANRAVTVDGAGQDYELAHWMGSILSTSDEKQAISIIRMLDCGSKDAYHTILDEKKDVLLSVNLTKTIIMQSKDQAKQTLQAAGLSQEAIDKTINYAFCNPPEHFLITSADMVGKSGVWAHFGYWDFNKAFMIREIRPLSLEEGTKLLREKFNYTEDQATGIYYDLQSLQTDREMNDWISPWPNYLTSSWYTCSLANATRNATSAEISNSSNNTSNNTNGTNAINITKQVLICPLNIDMGQGAQGRTIIEYILFDLSDKNNSGLVVGVYDATSGFKLGEGKIRPSSFVMLDNQTMSRIKMDNSTFPYDVLIDTVNSKALITDPLLSESLFTKLFYLDGRYTTRFEKFSDVTDITGQRIIVWKVKWE